MAPWGVSAQETAPDPSRNPRRTRVVEVVEGVRDSVVNISATQDVRMRRPSMFGMYFDEVFVYPQTTAGSGFVIHEDGYIVTNDHVVARSADHKVRFASGKEFAARVIASDAAHDLAILKIDPDSRLKPLKLGRSDDVMVGEDVIAIGNPFGLENTVTRGVVSAVRRRVEFSPDLIYDDLIQTDASINPGNSGGPLFNILGELIGINTAIRPEAENVGFAIPVDHLRRLLPDILDITHLSQVAFGMRVQGDRAEVTSIETDSPADKAGMRLGDVIVQVDGTTIGRDVDFYIAMLEHKVGDTVAMVYRRDGKDDKADITLTAVPTLDTGAIAWEKLGLRLEALSPKVARRVGLQQDLGLVITEIDPRGPARRSALQPSDLLVNLGRYRAFPVESVGTILQGVGRDDPVDVTVFRYYDDGTVERIRQRLYAR
ncbi:MAG: PDZ domain-containing protein [Phycisphaerales bacterium]|nr:PDZ domain-containing protein [Phycisphaerales bacterium]